MHNKLKFNFLNKLNNKFKEDAQFDTLFFLVVVLLYISFFTLLYFNFAITYLA